ncbi:hypothetical protein AX16_007637 [Volvariella volvacea WC 439]|nr:hypothetical protein AX16_007637 [Volvariella volvacea WC 439]
MYEAEGEGEGEEDDEGEREYDVDGLGEVDVDGLGEVDVDGYVDELGEVEMGDGEDGGELEGYEDPEEVYEARLEGKMRYIQSEVEDNQHCVASAGASASASGQSRIPVQRTAKVH